MGKPNLKAVDNSPLNTDEEFADALSAELEKQNSTVPASVGELVGVAARTLKRWISQMRTMEETLEAVKASASADYEKTVNAAKLIMEDQHVKADADLKALRIAMKQLEPARAGLAEQV